MTMSRRSSTRCRCAEGEFAAIGHQRLQHLDQMPRRPRGRYRREADGLDQHLAQATALERARVQVQDPRHQRLGDVEAAECDPRQRVIRWRHRITARTGVFGAEIGAVAPQSTPPSPQSVQPLGAFMGVMDGLLSGPGAPDAFSRWRTRLAGDP